MSKSPAFQFYAADFMIGIMGMSDDDVGVYIKMLSTQWLHGSLPNCRKTIKNMINSRKVPRSGRLALLRLVFRLLLVLSWFYASLVASHTGRVEMSIVSFSSFGCRSSREIGFIPKLI